MASSLERGLSLEKHGILIVRNRPSVIGESLVWDKSGAHIVPVLDQKPTIGTVPQQYSRVELEEQLFPEHYAKPVIKPSFKQKVFSYRLATAAASLLMAVVVACSSSGQPATPVPAPTRPSLTQIIEPTHEPTSQPTLESTEEPTLTYKTLPTNTSLPTAILVVPTPTLFVPTSTLVVPTPTLIVPTRTPFPTPTLMPTLTPTPIPTPTPILTPTPPPTSTPIPWVVDSRQKTLENLLELIAVRTDACDPEGVDYTQQIEKIGRDMLYLTHKQTPEGLGRPIVFSNGSEWDAQYKNTSLAAKLGKTGGGIIELKCESSSADNLRIITPLNVIDVMFHELGHAMQREINSKQIESDRIYKEAEAVLHGATLLRYLSEYSGYQIDYSQRESVNYINNTITASNFNEFTFPMALLVSDVRSSDAKLSQLRQRWNNSGNSFDAKGSLEYFNWMLTLNNNTISTVVSQVRSDYSSLVTQMRAILTSRLENNRPPLLAHEVLYSAAVSP